MNICIYYWFLHISSYINIVYYFTTCFICLWQSSSKIFTIMAKLGISVNILPDDHNVPEIKYQVYTRIVMTGPMSCSHTIHGANELFTHTTTMKYNIKTC
jgi:hypothetical protein